MPSNLSIPNLAELRSTDRRVSDRRVSDRAWQAAYPLLWAAAQQLLNVLLSGPHVHDREDIASRAIAEAARSLLEKDLPSFNQMRSFDDLISMTKQIVRARTKDFFRQDGRRKEDVTDVLPETAPLRAESEPQLSREDFDRLIALLPPPKPEIFRLHYYEGRTAEDIAERLAAPRSTILSHLSRGVKALRKHLEASRDSSATPSPTGDHELRIVRPIPPLGDTQPSEAP